MHPHLPSGPSEPLGPEASLPAQLHRLRAQLATALGTDAAEPDHRPKNEEERARRALFAHAQSSLDRLEECVNALLAAPPASARDHTLLGDAEWDLVRDEVNWSGEMYRLFAREPEQGPLRLDQLPAHLHPDDRRLVRTLLTGALVDGRPIDAEFRLVLPDGSARTVHCVGAPQLEPDGAVHSLWLALRDLARRGA
ncbi:PAS domain-containing protein [Streptacidiphilus monticola]|uniref:PAS domain-containing protein n=1 Tax=Streptacidiphilus monticola TaxID=2161674 RepID=A0ABW1FXE0_9ACTN